MGNEQKKAVLDFVQKIYQKRFGTVPSTISDKCVIANRSGKLIGAISIDYSSGEPFEIENYFEHGILDALGLRRVDLVSFGRWISEDDRASSALAYLAVRLAIKDGKISSFSCSKPIVLRRLRKHYHLKFNSVSTSLRVENIKPEDLKFFAEEPKPVLYTWDLMQWQEALEANLSKDVVISW